MPCYEFSCDHCEVVQLVHPMSEAHPKKCPQCGSSNFHQIFSVPATMASADAGWEAENHGMGRYLPQAGPRYLDAYTKTKPNPDAYARSRNDAIEKMKKRGYPTIEKD